jgi:membrane fusion protein, multidrug efflux system
MKKATYGPLALVLISFLLAACSKQQAAAPTPPPPEVRVVSLEARTVTLTRELPGRVNPFLVAEVRPQVGGIVRSATFTEGSFVKAGQVLYTLEDDTLRG